MIITLGTQTNINLNPLQSSDEEAIDKLTSGRLLSAKVLSLGSHGSATSRMTCGGNFEVEVSIITYNISHITLYL